MGFSIESMVTQTYHKDMGLPKGMPMPKAFIRLRYSPHAKLQAEGRDLTKLLPAKLPLGFQVIEVKMFQGQVRTWLVRVGFSATHDLVFSLTPDGFVRTIWANDKTDQHATLAKEYYSHV